MESRRQGFLESFALVYGEEHALFRSRNNPFTFFRERTDWASLRERGRAKGP
jgi:hypothetical protein